MKKLVILSISLLIIKIGFTQSKADIQVGSNQNLRELIANSVQYIEPDFILGRVIHSDGQVSEAFLNYNLLLEEMHFIKIDTEQGNDQILALGNPQEISFVSFGKRLFIWDSRYRYLEVLYNGKLKLLKKSKLEINTKEQLSDAYGAIPITSSTSRVTSFFGENFNYAPNREELLEANTTLQEKFFSQKSRSVRPISTKKALLKLSSKKNQQELSEYLDAFKMRWNDEKNLIEYFKFANSFEKE